MCQTDKENVQSKLCAIVCLFLFLLFTPVSQCILGFSLSLASATFKDVLQYPYIYIYVVYIFYILA